MILPSLERTDPFPALAHVDLNENVPAVRMRAASLEILAGFLAVKLRLPP